MRTIPDAVILAAGASRRMGRTKALLPLAGRPLLAWHVERLAGVTERVVVVVGADAERVRECAAGAVVVENPDWATTDPARSLQVGLRGAAVRGPCLVTPVDVAPADPAVLGALIDAGGPGVPVGPDGEGHPVLLDAALVARLRGALPEGGLRRWLASARRVAVATEVAADFDEAPAWEAFARAWGG